MARPWVSKGRDITWPLTSAVAFMAYFVFTQREYDFETVALRRRMRAFHKVHYPWTILSGLPLA